MKKLLCILLLFAVLTGCLVFFFPDRLPAPLVSISRELRQWAEAIGRHLNPPPQSDPDSVTYPVLRAVDGDTLLLSVDGAEVYIRLIGVDAPESVHPEAEKNTAEGETAAQWMKVFLYGKTVSLEYDSELYDRYGRTLAYVYVDGTLLEDSLLLSGMARTLIMEPNTRYQRHFEQLEKRARESGAGFWGTGFFIP